MSSSGYT